MCISFVVCGVCVRVVYTIRTIRGEQMREFAKIITQFRKWGVRRARSASNRSALCAATARETSAAKWLINLNSVPRTVLNRNTRASTHTMQLFHPISSLVPVVRLHQRVCVCVWQTRCGYPFCVKHVVVLLHTHISYGRIHVTIMRCIWMCTFTFSTNIIIYTYTSVYVNTNEYIYYR